MEQTPVEAAITPPVPHRRVAEQPKFVTGSIPRHILNMTAAGAVGLMAIFIGDLANIYFLSRLGDESVLAAVGYASTILFFSTSIGIGLSIAATSLVAPALGAGRRIRAVRLSTNAHVLTALVSGLLSLGLWFLINPMLSALGATGHTLDLAASYLTILLPTLPMLALGMTSSAVLRSVGDARRAMNVTLTGAILNILFDIVFILQLGFGIEGAAIASTIARIGVMAVGLYGVVRVHKLMHRPKRSTFTPDAKAFTAIAIPAVLTNLATPAGSAYVTAAMANYGDAAVAAWAIIGRIIPVAFGAIYALSGSVGPVLGQNYGAGLPDRMRGVFTASLQTMVAFTAVAWIILAIFAGPLADLFKAEGEARELIIFFCRWLSPLFVFLGALFVANAAFNTLGHPHYSTVINWLRATVGTVPFVLLGGQWAGAEGVLAGNMIGGIAFGIVSVMIGYKLINRLGLARARQASGPLTAPTTPPSH
jgi:putative MATE family efflux protein